MKCPVCNQDFELTLKDFKEDFYYDCDHCHSNLFFQGGECKVLNEGSLDQNDEEEGDISKGSAEESISEIQEEEDLEEPELTEVPELSVPEIEPEKDSDSDSEKEIDEEIEDSDIFTFENQQEDNSLEIQQEEALTSDLSEDSKQEEESLTPNLSEDSKQEEEALTSDLSEDSKQEEQELEGESLEAQNEDEKKSLEDFSEVTEYGNQQGLGEEGVFYYNLILSEINSEEVRKEVENILEDEALKLNPEKNNLIVEDGVLKISEISPVKVHIIVKSLVGLPVKVFWEQHLVIDKN